MKAASGAGARDGRDYYAGILLLLDDLVLELEGRSYAGVPIAGLIKIPVFSFFKNRYVDKDMGRMRVLAREVLSICRRLARLLVYRLRQLPFQGRSGAHAIALRADDRRVVFVMDHDNPNFLAMQLDLIGKFPPDLVVIITSIAELSRRLAGKFHVVHDTRDVLKETGVSAVHWRTVWTVLSASKTIARTDLLMRIGIGLDLLDALLFVDFYQAWLNPVAVRAVVTLNDVQSHENAITNAAKMKGIKTLTLQHGMMDPLQVPVDSDRIFVWGETTKRELMDLGVPEQKIIPAGRPGFDRIVEELKREREALRRAFFKRQDGVAAKTIVTYVAGNFGPDEERHLLQCFLSVCDLEMLPVVKLKPTISEEQVTEFKNWVEEASATDRVRLLYNEDMFELLAISDVAVGCASSALVEALPFSVVCIVLDLFDHVDLRAILPHYDDCLVARNASELRSLLQPLVDDEDHATALKRDAFDKSGKYFSHHTQCDCSTFIHDYIMSASNAGSGLGVR